MQNKRYDQAFVSKQVRKGKISFGLSSYGYDARVSNEFKIFTNVNSGIVDPKILKRKLCDKNWQRMHYSPNSFALARTVEYFKIPDVFSNLFRKIYLCKMWNYCKRYTFRARLGGSCYIRIF